MLSQLSSAIEAFDDDISLMGRKDDVIGMTYSEFGRRIKSNASYGCDHGTAAPMILFGAKLKGGLIGKNPQIQKNISVNDNLAVQTDFRSVYATILREWFAISQAEVDSLLFGAYPTLDLFHS